MDSVVFIGTAANPRVALSPGQVLQERSFGDLPNVMNIVVVQGDDKSVPVILSLNQYAPLDLSGATIKFTLKKSPADPATETLLSKSVGSGITVVDSAAGSITIDFVPADTNDLDAMLPLTFDIEVTSGGKKSTVERGVFTVSSGTS